MRPGENGELIFDTELEAQAVVKYLLNNNINIAPWIYPPLPDYNLRRRDFVLAQLGTNPLGEPMEFRIRDEFAVKATILGLETVRFSAFASVLGLWTLTGYALHSLQQYEYQTPPSFSDEAAEK